MTVMNIVKRFIKETKENGGCSVNFTTGEVNPTQGYFVSLQGHEKRYYLEGFGTLSMASYICSVENDLKPELFVGSWVNEGDVCMDLSEQIYNKRTAIELAYQRNQLAIYDAYEGKVINLPARQRTGTATQQRAYITSVINRLCE